MSDVRGAPRRLAGLALLLCTLLAVLAACGRLDIPVREHAARLVKKAVVGSGHAQKQQVAMMVATLLPKAGPVTADAADALAVAICHAHMAQSAARIAGAAT